MSIAYIPRIDHNRRQAVVVNRYPGKSARPWLEMCQANKLAPACAAAHTRIATRTDGAPSAGGCASCSAKRDA